MSLNTGFLDAATFFVEKVWGPVEWALTSKFARAQYYSIQYGATSLYHKKPDDLNSVTIDAIIEAGKKDAQNQDFSSENNVTKIVQSL